MLFTAMVFGHFGLSVPRGVLDGFRNFADLNANANAPPATRSNWTSNTDALYSLIKDYRDSVWLKCGRTIVSDVVLSVLRLPQTLP